MALERHSQEERDLIRELKAGGMNRRDRVARIRELRAGGTEDPGGIGDEQRKVEERSVSALTREPGKFRVDGSMQEVGQVAAGLASIGGTTMASLGVGTDFAVLYDAETGKLYKTDDWSDVQRNFTSLVSASGERQRVANVSGVSEGKGESAKLYNRASRASDTPFGVDVVYGLSEKIPEAGTDEFQEWLGAKFNEGVSQQAAAHRYSKETGSTGTRFGQFGSISYSDWVDLGRPRSIGSDTVQISDEDYDMLSKYSDEQLRAATGQYLTTVDKKVRSHGLRKPLDSIGKAIGYDHLSGDVMNGLKHFAQLDVGATKLLYNMQTAYENTRTAGKSAGKAWHETGKAAAYTVAEQTVEGVRDLLIVLSAYTAWTGAGGAVFGSAAAGAASLGSTLGATAAAAAAGAAVGAASGYASAYATTGAYSSIYGGYDAEYRKSQRDAAEKGAASGALSGAVTGATMGLGAVGAGKGAWGGFATNPVPTAASAALRLGSNYVSSRYIYDMSAKDANSEALLGLAATAFGAYQGRSADSRPTLTGNSFADDALAKGDYSTAFRESFSGSHSSVWRRPVGYLLGGGTETRAWYDYASENDKAEGHEASTQFAGDLRARMYPAIDAGVWYRRNQELVDSLRAPKQEK